MGLMGTPISDHESLSSTIVSETSNEVKNAKVRSEIGTMQIVDSQTPFNDLTDEQLLGAHAAGKDGAYEVLIERYRNELLHFLIRFLSSRAAAEDVFQDTFLQIHLVADTFDTSRRFKPWLYTIAANKARDHHRKQKRRAAASLSAPIGRSGSDEVEFIDLLAGDDENPEVPISEAEQAQLVKTAVDELPVHYREILLLSYFQKMSYNQIADALDIPLGTVKSRLHSAVGCFAENWKARESSRDSGGTAS
jgi:RNA polymerase sigma-70 factor (ECF subfamily)